MSTSVNVPDDFAVDLGGRFSLEDAVEWASEAGVHAIDVRLTNRLDPAAYSESEVEQIKTACQEHEISLGLHTLSAVNTAEFSPLLNDAVDEYLFAFVDIASKVDADRTIVHAGYHFTNDEEARTEASLDRLKRVAAHAEKRGTNILLENMNPEPEDAEVHYLCSKLEDVQHYFDRLTSPNLGWAFNPPHAHLHEEGIDGYLDSLDLSRCREVRLNDNRGVREEHLMPGEGTIDFEHLFDRLESMGYTGPLTVALGSVEDSLEGIRRLAELR